MSNDINDLGQPVGRYLSSWVAPSPPARIILSGRYCRLEPLDPEKHALELFKANSLDDRGANWTYMRYGPFTHLESYRRWVTVQSSSEDPLYYAIVTKADCLPGGVTSYLQINPANGSIEVGHLNFSLRLQRTAAATEAMYLMMRYAFELGYRRYEWKCDALNGPSRKAARRLGFTFEGVHRQAGVRKGRTLDAAWYSIIDSEWPSLRIAIERWLNPSNFDVHGNQINSLTALTQPLLKNID